MSDGHNPYRLMQRSQRLLALARRDGVDTSRRSEVDRWYAEWKARSTKEP